MNVVIRVSDLQRAVIEKKLSERIFICNADEKRIGTHRSLSVKICNGIIKVCYLIILLRNIRESNNAWATPIDINLNYQGLRLCRINIIKDKLINIDYNREHINILRLDNVVLLRYITLDHTMMYFTSQ